MANTYDSFEQYISENAALRQTLADTLTEKGVEASGKEGYATLVEKVGAIEAGVKLPTLSNPASPSEILSGYEAINEAGEVVTGSNTNNATYNEITLSDFTLSTAKTIDIGGENFKTLIITGTESAKQFKLCGLAGDTSFGMSLSCAFKITGSKLQISNITGTTVRFTGVKICVVH